MSSLPQRPDRASLDPRRRARAVRRHQPAGFLTIALPRLHDIHAAIVRALLRAGITR